MRRSLGIQGETIAAKTLEQKGYKIINVNFTSPLGEIDLIAWEQDVLVFIEVRSRSESTYGWPSETVNKIKQKKIRRVAEFFLVTRHLEDVYCRFDVVSIVWGLSKANPQIEIIEDAF